MKPKSSAYRRLPDQARKQLLIDSTLHCMAKHGLSGTTMRKIAEQAGVTAGLVTHHFNSKEELIAAAYDHISAQFLPSVLTSSATMNPLERLQQFIYRTFQLENRNSEQLRIWVGFWTLVVHDPRLKAMHQKTAKRTRRYVVDLLQAAFEFVGRPVESNILHDKALALLCLLDGVWLARGLDPQLLSSEQAGEMALTQLSAQLDLPELLT